MSTRNRPDSPQTVAASNDWREIARNAVDRTGFFHFAVKEQRGGDEVFFDPQEAGFAYRLSGPAVV